MKAKEGHVSAAWLASDAAAEYRRQPQHQGPVTANAFNASGWTSTEVGNCTRISWEELLDARQAVASVAHVWGEEHDRECRLRARWPWRLLTKRQFRSAASARETERKRLRASDPQPGVSAYTATLENNGLKATASKQATCEQSSEQYKHLTERQIKLRKQKSETNLNYPELAVDSGQYNQGTMHASQDRMRHKGSISEGSSTSCSFRDDTPDSSCESHPDDDADSSNESTRPLRPAKKRLITRASLGRSALERTSQLATWCCHAGIPAHTVDADPEVIECGHENPGSERTCLQCAMPRWPEDGQLRMRTLAAIQTCDDMSRVTPREVTQQLRAFSGSRSHSGLQYTEEQVEQEMKALFAKHTERRKRTIKSGLVSHEAIHTQFGHSDAAALQDDAMPLERYLASLYETPSHGSQRVDKALLRLRLSFVRLAEYMATAASFKAPSHNAQELPASPVSSGMLASSVHDADAAAKQQSQESIVKAAQISLNFAVDLVQNLLSKTAAANPRSRLAQHRAPKRNFLGVNPIAHIQLPVTGPTDASGGHDARQAPDIPSAASVQPPDRLLHDPPQAVAPVAVRRLLPLASLEAVYAPLPHYPSPADLPLSTVQRPKAPATRLAKPDVLASRQLLGSIAGSAAGTDHSAAQKSTRQGASAFQPFNLQYPSFMPLPAKPHPPRRRYTAPADLIYIRQKLYRKTATTMRGRVRYDRLGLYHLPPDLEVAAVTQRRHESLDLVGGLDRVAPDVCAVFGSAAEMGVPPQGLRNILAQFENLPREPSLETPEIEQEDM